MSKHILFSVSDSTPLAELYQRLGQGVDIIEQHTEYAHKRALPTVQQAIGHLRRFISGELGTRPPADVEYVKLQTAYVNFAFKGVDEFLRLADKSIPAYFEFAEERAA